MLRITIPSVEQYDDDLNKFVNSKEQVLQLEHSLVSLSKWESKWKKPFLSKGEKTVDETLDYIRCMTTNQHVDESAYMYLTDENLLEVRAYIEDDMTATTFSKEQEKSSREVVTAEIIYHWMVAMNIPFECQKWHLNRLLTLVKVCSLKNNPPKKGAKKDILRRNASLNEARKKALILEVEHGVR